MTQFWIGIIVGASGVVGALAILLGIGWWADGKTDAHVNRPPKSAA